ncbi:glutathione S-transferase [Patellaria atrata CBS 101060]|uniref:Glutathione S-transferase n=1 Tax=Patellaria atrata CBS 101060 TaxID=1346257 RepID=A0A9P4SIM6_9PEZI|nr:glutathione S-transferase [Patellaria atrata CBS 101060]
MSVPNNIILFHYPYSPFARRVTWYLTLRGIEYAQCIQPPILPRKDLSDLGISYRRIPLMSIGRDVYLDSRLILRKLEAKFPDGALGAKSGEQQGIQRLLERYTIDSGLFDRAASLLPSSLPLMQDPKFKKDREEFSGRSWSEEDLEKRKPESLVYVRDAFNLLETTLLADGRDWILRSEKVTLADIEAIWVFHWLVELNALPQNVVSAETYPKVYAWIARFRAALKSAKSSAPKPVSIQGPDAIKHIINAEFAEPSGGVDKSDPLALNEGDDVELWPIDSGFSHHDRGKLVVLTPEEVTVASRNNSHGKEIRIHAGRWGFRVARATGGTESSRL